MNRNIPAATREAIDQLESRLNAESDFFELLNASLLKAKETANGVLNGPLFDVLDWPTTLDQYLAFLESFSVWIPQQSDNPAWNDSEYGHSQEVYDRLCHFYFLIDQGVGPDGTTIVQNIDGFDEWLVTFANLWGGFLDTTDSFDDTILATFENSSPKYRVQDSMIDGKPNNPSGWLTFNQFFARELNPGLRPIAMPLDNSVVTCPADCTYRMKYDISADSTIPEIIVKKTHTFADINTLLAGSDHAGAFANGTFVHYFLGPYSYHRFHAPVSGVVDDSFAIQGLTYLQVNIDAQTKQFDAPDDAEGGYEFAQARGVLTIDTTDSEFGDVGIVGVIPVGMCQVSSVNMTAQKGRALLKGDEFGYFLFGGSDIILLFQQGHAPIIDTCSNYRYYGTDISICPDNPR